MKKRGSKQFCLSRYLGSRIAFQLRISNVEAHAVGLLVLPTSPNNMKYYRNAM